MQLVKSLSRHEQRGWKKAAEDLRPWTTICKLQIWIPLWLFFGQMAIAVWTMCGKCFLFLFCWKIASNFSASAKERRFLQSTLAWSRSEWWLMWQEFYKNGCALPVRVRHAGVTEGKNKCKWAPDSLSIDYSCMHEFVPSLIKCAPPSITCVPLKVLWQIPTFHILIGNVLIHALSESASSVCARASLKEINSAELLDIDLHWSVAAARLFLFDGNSDNNPNTANAKLLCDNDAAVCVCGAGGIFLWNQHLLNFRALSAEVSSIRLFSNETERK